MLSIASRIFRPYLTDSFLFDNKTMFNSIFLSQYVHLKFKNSPDLQKSGRCVQAATDRQGGGKRIHITYVESADL